MVDNKENYKLGLGVKVNLAVAICRSVNVILIIWKLNKNWKLQVL